MVASPKWCITQNAFTVVHATVEKYKSTISLICHFLEPALFHPSLVVIVIGDTWEGSALISHKV